MNDNNCPVHNCPWKEVPAGVNKEGKAYNAFKVCQVRECKEKPQRPAGGFRSLNQPLIVRQVAFKGAIDLVAAGRIEPQLLEAMVNRFEQIINKIQSAQVSQATQESDVPTIQVDTQENMDVENIPF